MHTYIKSEPRLYTVGHYDPNGRWQPESDWGNREDAAARAAYLNGVGSHADWERGPFGPRRVLEDPLPCTGNERLEDPMHVTVPAVHGMGSSTHATGLPKEEQPS
jgi:hypothetical protein